MNIYLFNTAAFYVFQKLFINEIQNENDLTNRGYADIKQNILNTVNYSYPEQSLEIEQHFEEFYYEMVRQQFPNTYAIYSQEKQRYDEYTGKLNAKKDIIKSEMLGLIRSYSGSGSWLVEAYKDERKNDIVMFICKRYNDLFSYSTIDFNGHGGSTARFIHIIPYDDFKKLYDEVIDELAHKVSISTDGVIEVS